MLIKRGDIFIVDWSRGRGSEQAGERPSVIVQTDLFNRNPNYPNTVVVAVSKSGRDVSSHVKIVQTAENGLWEPFSYVKCEQMVTISKGRLKIRIGQLTPEQIDRVTLAIKRVLDTV